MGVLVRGWPMFLAACGRGIRSAVGGRGKMEVLPFEFKSKETRERVLENVSASDVPVRQTARR